MKKLLIDTSPLLLRDYANCLAPGPNLVTELLVHRDNNIFNLSFRVMLDSTQVKRITFVQWMDAKIASQTGILIVVTCYSFTMWSWQGMSVAFVITLQHCMLRTVKLVTNFEVSVAVLISKSGKSSAWKENKTVYLPAWDFFVSSFSNINDSVYVAQQWLLFFKFASIAYSTRASLKHSISSFVIRYVHDQIYSCWPQKVKSFKQI